jgi:hypothetical protein
MRRFLLALLVLGFISSVHAQGRGGAEHYRSDGFYIMLGAADGPSFSSFFNYIDDTYRVRPNERLKDFGSNVAFQLGYISRFHRNFALDVGISVYGLKSKGAFTNNDSLIAVGRISHDLQYQVGIFTVTIPIIFEFMPRQKIIPYVGIGISIFAERLDDFRDAALNSGTIRSDAFRDTRTSVGGHFEAGVGYKINQRIWLDLRGRWHGGSGHLSTLEANSANDLIEFAINQSVSQYMLGVDYYFR